MTCPPCLPSSLPHRVRVAIKDAHFQDLVAMHPHDRVHEIAGVPGGRGVDGGGATDHD